MKHIRNTFKNYIWYRTETTELLDVTDENIRKAEMELAMVKEFIDKGYEVLVTGDFNAREESVIYDEFTAVLADARKTAKRSTEMNTFNGY